MTTPASRDRGVKKIGRVTRYVAAGSLVVGGILSGALARALPGHSTKSASTPAAPPAASPYQAPPTTAQQQSSSNTAGGSVSSPAELTPPATLPRPSRTIPQATSGGS